MFSCSLRRVLFHALTCAAALFIVGANLATASTWVGDSSSNWNTAANWDSDPLDPTGNFTVNNTANPFPFPVLSANSAFTPVDIIVGVGATGRFDHTAGTASTGNGNWVIVGRNNGGNGTYNLANTGGVGGTYTGFSAGTGSMDSGGTSITSGRLLVGDTGTSIGTVNMFTSGTLELEDNNVGMLLGNAGTSTGNFNLDGGTVNINSTATEIGILAGTNGGDGNFKMSGGTVNVTGGIWAGDNNAGSQGSIQVSGGSLNMTATSGIGNGGAGSAGQLMVGRGLGQGTMTVSGGTVTITGAANVGFTNTATAGTTGLLTVSGGSFSTTTDMRVGSAQNGNGVIAAGSGTFNVSGGTATIGGLLEMARGNDAGDLVTGSSTVSGTGTLTVVGDLVLAYAGNNNLGEMFINGGTVNVATTGEKWLIVNRWDTSRGELTVNGGTLNLNQNSDLRFSTGNGTGTSKVTLTSGAITAYSGNQTGASTSSVVDLMQANVAGNNTFNLDGGTLTINQIITNQNNGTAVFNFNGGTLKANGNTANFVDLGGAGQTAVVKAGGAIIHSNGFDVTIPQALLAGAPSGGLTKEGNGTLTLSGANTYTGATIVNGGTLQMNSTNATSASVTVNNGSRLALNIGDALGFTAGKNVPTINSGSTITNITAASRVTLWNGLTMTGGTLTSTSAGDANGAYSLSGSVIATSDASGNAAIISGNPISLQNQNVANGTITFNVTAGVMTPASDLTVSANLIPFTAWPGNGITKTGNGILTLSGANTFTGAVNIDAGTLRADRNNNNFNPTNSALGNPQAARNINVNNGGTLVFVQGDTLGGATTNVVSTLVINQGGTVTNTGFNFTTLGPVNLNGGTLTTTGGAAVGYQSYNLRGTVTVGGTAASTISGSGGFSGYHLAAPTTFNVGDVTLGTDLTVSANLIDQDATHGGSGTLLKTGAGTMVLSGANTYTGDTFVKDGTLALTGSISSGAGRVIVGNAGGTAALTIAGGSSLTTSEFVIGDNDAGYSGAPTTLSGTATMAGGSVTASNWLLLGRQGGTGVFNQQGGTVTNSSTATGYVGIGWHFAGGGGSGTYNLSNNAVLNANSAVNYGGIGPTSIVIANLAGDNGLMALSNTAQVIASNRVVLAAQGGAGTLTLNDNSSLSLTGAGGDGGVLVFAGTGNINVNGGTLSANYLTLGQNIGSNGTVTQTGGTVSLTTLWTTFDGTGTYNLNGGTLSVAGFNKGTGAGTMYFNGGTLQATAGWTLGGGNVTTTQIRDGGLIIDTNGQNPTISNVLAHSTLGGDNALDGGLTKNNGGTLTLTASNTYTGGTTINAGTIITATVGAPMAGALGTGAVTVNAGTTLQSNTGDSFGYFGGAPSVININGGTVTTGGVGNFRTTLPDLNMTGGTVTSAAGNAGDASGVFSMNAGSDVTVNASATTSTIGTGNPAAGFGLQDVHTFNVANGAAAVDLLVSANLTDVTYAPPTPGGVTKTGAGLMRLSGTNTYTGNTLANGGILEVSATGSITQSSGISAADNGSGQIDVNGGSIATPGFIVAGLYNGTGTINLNTGSATANIVTIGAIRPFVGTTVGTFNVGGGASAATLTTNELWVSEAVSFGGTNASSGTMNVMNNADVNVAVQTIVGYHDTANGLLSMSGGDLSTPELIVANDPGSSGVVNHMGGTVHVTAASTLDIGLGGTGEYNLSGGTLNVAGHAILGDAGGSGDFNHTGGTANITRDLTIGDSNNATLNNYNLSGGVLNFGDSAGVGSHWGPGTDPASSITINSDGAFNFTGGTLQEVTSINTPGGAGTFTQSDDTLVAGASHFYIGKDAGPGEYAQTTTIDGGFSLLGGVLHIDVFGIDPTPEQCCDSNASQNDQLTVDGVAYLNSTIALDYEGFDPEFGETFTILCAEDISYGPGFHLDGGFFRIINVTGDPNGPQALQAIVPEPASIAVWTIMGLAGAGGALRLRRRKGEG